MTKTEFDQILVSLKDHFPGQIQDTLPTRSAWMRTLQDLSHQDATRAARIIERELEFIRPGANVAAMILTRARPLITNATVENHLFQAIAMMHSPEGRPYEYLRGVDRRLLELAEMGDMFARDLSSEATGFRVRDIARRFLEERENAKRGYRQPELVPVERQIAPPPVEMTEEQRQANLSRLRSIQARLGCKPETETKETPA